MGLQFQRKDVNSGCVRQLEDLEELQLSEEPLTKGLPFTQCVERL